MKQSEHDIDFGRGTMRITLYGPDDDRSAKRMVLVVTDPAYDTDARQADAFREAVAGALTSNGARVACYDSRTNQTILEDYHQLTTTDQIDEATAVYRWLLVEASDRDQPVDLIGIGLGAVIVAGLLERAPERRRIVLVGPVTADVVRGQWSGNGTTAEVRADLLPEQTVATIEDIDHLKGLLSAKAPVLLIHGAADVVTPVSTSLKIERALHDANHPVELRLVPFADHYFSEQDGRQACAQAIAEFLRA